MAPSGRKTERLRQARCRYNHLAGRIGIAVTRSLRERGLIMELADQGYEVTPAGISWFTFMGVEVLALKLNRYGLVRQCLDWTERELHLAGPLGDRPLAVLKAKGWPQASDGSRALEVTPQGRLGLRAVFGFWEKDEVAAANPRLRSTAQQCRPDSPAQPAASRCAWQSTGVPPR
jgi:hypothetical protein